jgi:hypothetical protein
MNALAASGDLLPAPILAVKMVVLASSPGSGPTSWAPAIGTISDACPMPSSASPLAICGLGARHQYGLSFHLLGYSETIEDAGEIDTACPAFRGVRISNRSVKSVCLKASTE